MTNGLRRVNLTVESGRGQELANAYCAHARREAGLRVWDLRLLWQRLGEFGLDWSADPLPPATEAPELPPVELDTGS